MLSFGKSRRKRSRSKGRKRSRSKGRKRGSRSGRSTFAPARCSCQAGDIRLSKKRGPRGGKRYIKPKGMSCKEFLSKKIAENTREFKQGKLLSNGRKITSRQQAIAISYSQAKSAGCKFKK